MSLRQIYCTIFALSLCACLPCSCVQASITYDLSTEFDPNSNPSSLGPWSYGWEPTLGGAFGLLTVQDSSGTTNGWHRFGTDAPAVSKNFGSSSVQITSVHWLPGQTVFHPGPGGQYGIYRFTVPVGGLYDIDVAFSGNDEVGTSTSVHVISTIGSLSTILFNASVTSAWNTSTNTPGPGPSYSSLVPLLLSAGDKIDFLVGFGTDYYHDTTGISGQITFRNQSDGAAPELDSIVCWSILSALGLTVWRRQRTSVWN